MQVVTTKTLAICTAGWVRSLEQPSVLRRQLTAIVKPHTQPAGGGWSVDLLYELTQEVDDFVHERITKLRTAIEEAIRATSMGNGMVRLRSLKVMLAQEEEFQMKLRLRSGFSTDSAVSRRMSRHTAVLQLWGWQSCLDSIQHSEMAMNVKYKLVVRHRADSYWFLPMPSIAAIQSSLMAEDTDDLPLLAPSFGAYGGVNDRFAIMPRKYAESYFGAFDTIVTSAQWHRVCDVRSFSRRHVRQISNVTGPAMCGLSLEAFLLSLLVSFDILVLRRPWFPFHILRPAGCFKQEPFVRGSSPCFALPQPFLAQCVRWTCTGDASSLAAGSGGGLASIDGSSLDNRQRLPDVERGLVIELVEEFGQPPGAKLIETAMAILPDQASAPASNPAGSTAQAAPTAPSSFQGAAISGSETWLAGMRVWELEEMCERACSAAMCIDPRCFFWQLAQTWPHW
mmetsp:Transcript_80490/g.260672  ORF Transcript_80490/g.260672 Transcript_80490/m.260672 type:complete len:453 (-) Transcript_80490:439-1797(-)